MESKKCFWLCEPFGGHVLRWSGSVTNHHYLCCLIRPMFSVMCGLSCFLFMVVGCSCFYVVFIFSTDIYTFIYFALFLKGFFI